MLSFVARLAWLLLPLLGLLELIGVFTTRAPSLAEWRAAAPELTGAVGPIAEGGGAVVVRPPWAAPLARHVLGDDIIAVDPGRAPVAVLRLASWSPGPEPIEASRRVGPFVVDRLRRSGPRLRHLVDAFGPAVVVVDGTGSPCPHGRYPPMAGGLHGHGAIPADRAACPGSLQRFAGVTYVEDARYRPHRCLAAHPGLGGVIALSFPSAPLAGRVTLSGGFPWFRYRDRLAVAVRVAVRRDDVIVGERRFRAGDGWTETTWDVAAALQGAGLLTVTVTALPGSAESGADPPDRRAATPEFCFDLTTPESSP